VETVGIFTLSLRLVRKLLPFLLDIIDKLTALQGGLIGQLIALFLIWKFAPLLADFIGWALEIFIKLLEKFEG
jgi:hypothetical protein